jgi:predicted small metal-binding protein
MRVIECDLCGQALSAANDDELARTVSHHMSERHPESVPDDAQVRALVGEHAYDASDS